MPRATRRSAAAASHATGAAARWFWAGDGPGGSQSEWIEYDAATSAKLEQAYNEGKSQFAVDTHRFVDMKDQSAMGQRRYDAPDRVRKVKREAPSGGGAAAAAAAPAPAPAPPPAPTVKWSWAGDGPSGSQSVWIEYDGAMAAKLEAAFQAGQKQCAVDKERFIDMDHTFKGGVHYMGQRRYDAPDRVRKVRREDLSGGAVAMAPPPAPAPAPAPVSPPAKSKRKAPDTKSTQSGGGKMVKLLMKGGKAPVDERCPASGTHRVYDEGDTVYDVMLNQTNIGNNNNKFYVIQLLQHDSGTSDFIVYTRWGRVGAGGQNSTDRYSDLAAAKAGFEKKFREKTSNTWAQRKSFRSVPGKYTLIHRDFSTDVAAAAAPAGTQVSVPDSTLPETTQSLVSLISNVEMMKQTMLEIGYDPSRMPLGKLGKATIKQGYEVLKRIAEVLDGRSRERLQDLSSEFYTVVPHEFGMSVPPVISRQDMLKQKLDMVATLSDAALAANLLGQQGSGKNPIDEAHDKLKAAFFHHPKTSSEFKLVERYVRDVFDVDREGEAARYTAFKGLHNRQLLWHGSRLSNFVGIISQGLRIAPPEAPVTGYMFGKGVYFADMSSKSANYCCTTRSSNVGLLLLCEVALGDMRTLKAADYTAGDKTKLGSCHSTFGVGKTRPDPAGAVTMADGCVVPCGKPAPSGVTDTALLYNEFIVYDVSQVKVRYLVKLKFHYR